jgi:2TM family of unknown function (DUF5676)
MGAEKTMTHGDHLAATSTKRGGVRMHVLHWKPMTWSLGVFAAVTFVVCIVYGLLVPKALHMTEFLEITLPGFRWLSVGTFALGFVESFLYGAYAGLVYTPIHNVFARRFGVYRGG